MKKCFAFQKILLMLIFGMLFLFDISSALAEVGIGYSEAFNLDTRENLPPDGNWQILTQKGDSYNEDVLIDNYGKVWAFYLRSKGKGQPVYMKILNPDGYVYKSEAIVGNATALQSGKYQTVRACLNPKTGDVWVAIQGSQQGQSQGYFVIYDSEGNLRSGPTYLTSNYTSATGTYYPKPTCDKDGKIWFVWQTDSTAAGRAKSVGEFACYNSDGDQILAPTRLAGQTGDFSGADIAIDSNNRVWFVYERGNNSIYRKILNNDDSGTFFKDELLIASGITVPFGAQRVVKADTISHRVWIFAKNETTAQQRIFIYDLDGDSEKAVLNLGEATFTANELNRLEVIQYDDYRYKKSEYHPTTGSTQSSWMDLFNPAYEFVANGATYNRDYELLKVYLVQTDTSTTKFYLEPIQRAPSIYVSPTSIAFDSVLIETTSEKLVQISNEGTSRLLINNISASNNQYSVDVSQFSLEPGERRTVTVTFRPVVYDSIKAELNVASNDQNNPNATIMLAGVGRRLKDQKIAVSTNSLEFGTIAITSFHELQLSVSNIGEKTLYVDSIRVGDSQFTSSADTLQISPGVERTVTVTYRPTVADAATTQMIIYSDDMTNQAVEVSLSGTGREKTPPSITVSPESLTDFETVLLSDSTRRVWTIHNGGEESLEVTSIATSDKQFRPDTNRITVESGRDFELGVTFRPTYADTFDVDLTIANNDPSEPSIVRALKGIGEKVKEQDIFVSTDSIYFGGVKIGTERRQYFYIQNAGDLELQVTSIAVSNSNFSVSPSSVNLSPGEIKYIYATFAPDQEGPFTGQLAVLSDDPDTGSWYIDLVGAGQTVNPPQLVVNREFIDFGDIEVNTAKQEQLWVHNPGDLALFVTSVVPSDANYTANATSFELDAGTSRWITVTFQPTEIGTDDAELLLTSNDPARDELILPLKGSGRMAKQQQISVFPTSINFGTLLQKSTGTKYLYIQNIGEQDLHITELHSTDDQFAVSTAPFTLKTEEIRQLPVSFTPQFVTTTQAEIIITSDSQTSSTVNVPVIGTGKEPRPPELWVSNSASGWNFGDVAIDQESRIYFQMTNLGENDLYIYSIQINDQQFATENFSGILSPGASRYQYAYFTPTSQGTQLAKLTIQSNDPLSPTRQVDLRGEGRNLYPQNITLEPSEIVFGRVPVGTQSNKQVWINNTGEEPLTVQSIVSTDDQFSVNSGSFTVEGNNRQLVIVSFAPSSLDTAVAQLNITSDDPDAHTIVLPLSGGGRELDDQKIWTSTDQLIFGTVGIQKEKQLMLSIQNVGEKILHINQISLNDIRFTVSETNFSLSPFELKSLAITFRPTSEGEVVAKLTIFNDDPTAPAKEIALTGTGRAVTPQTIALNPSSIDFGSIGQNLSTSLPVIISNSGEETLQINSISIEEIQNNDGFSVPYIAAFGLLPGESQALSINFSPGLIDTFRAILKIESNDPNNGEQELPLVGVGRARNQSQISLKSRAIDFDSVAVGGRTTKYLTVSNIGEMPLSIYNITSNNNQFVADTSNFELVPYAEKAIGLTFSPMSYGPISGQLTILSNDPDSSQVNVTLTGVGRDLQHQSISVTPDSVLFDSVAIGQVQTQNLWIGNSGDETLNIHSITSSDSQFSVRDSVYAIPSGMEEKISVTFAPKKSGTLRGSLAISSDDPENLAMQVSVSGFGRMQSTQQIMVTPSTLNFEDVPIDYSSPLPIFISNLGEDTLFVTGVESSNSQFTVSETALAVPAYDSKQLMVSFRPATQGTFQAMLTIFNNDPINDQVEIELFGSGREWTPQQISIENTSLNFGEIGWGLSGTQTLKIANQGERSLSVENITSTNPHFIAALTNFSVAAGSHQIVPIVFTPLPAEGDSAQRAFNGALTVQSNDPQNPSQEISLQGLGRPLMPPIISIQPPEIYFNTVAVNREKIEHFYVKNEGEGTLSVAAIQVASEDDRDQFKFSPNAFAVAAADSKRVSITYAPTRVATLETLIQVTSNDTVAERNQIPLFASAVEYIGPQISIEPDTLGFGSILTGSQRVQAISISNDGPKTLNVYYINSSNGDAFSTDMYTLQVESGGSKSVSVSFHPKEHGEYAERLIIESDDTYSTITEIALTGTGFPDTTGSFELGPDWAQNSAPFGDGLGQNSTSGVLGASQTKAWFINDFYVYSNPTSARLNITYNEGAQVFINGILAFDWSDENHTMWDWRSENVLPYLNLGRNRIAVAVFNQTETGGFDAELLINSAPVIASGNDNYNQPGAFWWYYWVEGDEPPPPSADTRTSWYAFNYGWSGLDERVASWEFEQALDDVIFDVSSYGRRAVLHGATIARGIKGNGLSFDGDDDYVDLEVNINNSPVTIELWLKCSAATSDSQTVFDNRSSSDSYGYSLYLDQNLNLMVRYFNGIIRTTRQLVPEKYYFISMRFSDNGIVVYLNGERIIDFAYSLPNNPRREPIGQSHTYLGRSVMTDAQISPFNGIIDEFNIYNIEKTTSEVPSVASLVFAPISSMPAGIEHVLNFRVAPANAQVSGGKLTYAPGGSINFQERVITIIDDTTFSVPIPAEAITVRGVKYRLDLDSDIGAIRHPEGPDTTQTDWLTVSTAGQRAPFKTFGSIYRMVSVPYDVSGKSAGQVLADDFGNYDPYNWRLFKMIHSQYAEITPDHELWPDLFARGQAAWLVSWEGNKPIDADSGRSAADNDPFELTLQPGWNQIACPFPYPVAWSSVSKDENYVSIPYFYNPENRGYDLDVAAISPWEGYFVNNYNSGPEVISIPPVEMTEPIREEEVPLAKSLLAQVETAQLALNISAACEKIRDNDNVMAVVEGASNGWDRLDAWEAPPIGTYISLRVDNRDWKDRPGDYAIDVRAAGERGYIWKLKLDGKAPRFAETVTLDFEQSVDLPKDQELYLFDLQDEVAINLKKEAHYEFDIESNEAYERRFKLVAGDEAFILEQSEGISLQPLEFELSQNYPNPFNPVTAIRFSLPKKSHTTLIIYNVLGQQVKTLIDGTMRAAKHSVIWNGTNDAGKTVASGIYIMRLRSEDKLQIRKMTLIK